MIDEVSLLASLFLIIRGIASTKNSPCLSTKSESRNNKSRIPFKNQMAIAVGNAENVTPGEVSAGRGGGGGGSVAPTM